MNFNNMTLEELAKFNREYDELQAAYASAAEYDAKMQTMNTIPDEWEDEMEYWSRAGLDSRGRP